MVKLEEEFNFYLQNQNELVKKYRDKYIVIMHNELLGAYDSEFEAIKETSKKHKLGTFLVQKCEPGTDNYTQTYHSRVTFA